TQAEVDALIEKGLVFAVTPAGRGQTFAHTLYTPLERQHLAAKVEKQATAAAAPAPAATPTPPAGAVANESRVDRISERLDEVTARLEALEAKLADWET